MTTRPTYSCAGKRQPLEKGLADAAASRMAHRTGDRAHAYRCRACHAWHVGSSVIPKAKRAGVSRR